MRPANRGRDEWTHWQDEVRAEVSEGGEDSPGADTSQQLKSWSSTLVGDHILANGMLLGPKSSQDLRTPPTASGMQWSQSSKRAKPTRSDLSDDQRSDAAMPSGTTSKTWKPGLDRPFWSRTYSQLAGGASS